MEHGNLKAPENRNSNSRKLRKKDFYNQKKKGYSTGQNPMQAAHFAANQIVKKETLYNGNHDLGNGMYNVEMLISQTDDLVISA